jgi:hypothetical protein
VELIIDYGLTDIVAEHYDAGVVRLGQQVTKDMIAVRLDPRCAWPSFSPAAGRARRDGRTRFPF